ncbi:MAG: hypothetical protein ACRD0G_12210 [Acidimicrobiales bacterium]
MIPTATIAASVGLGWPMASVPRVPPRFRLPWYPPSTAQFLWLGHHPRLLGAWAALAGPAEFGCRLRDRPGYD